MRQVLPAAWATPASSPAGTYKAKRYTKIHYDLCSWNAWAWWPGRSSKPVCGRKTSVAVRFPRIPLLLTGQHFSLSTIPLVNLSALSCWSADKLVGRNWRFSDDEVFTPGRGGCSTDGRRGRESRNPAYSHRHRTRTYVARNSRAAPRKGPP